MQKAKKILTISFLWLSMMSRDLTQEKDRIDSKWPSACSIYSNPYSKDPTNSISFDQMNRAFEHGERLGKGAFGEVRMVNIRGTDYAVKKVMTTHGSYLLKREINVLFEINKIESVLSVVDCQVDKYFIYIIQKPLYKDLSKLETILFFKSKKNLLERLKIYHKTIKALNEIHNNNIIHADIKPANMMLDSRECNNLVLIDFGLVRFKSEIGTVGTPVYFTPELVNESNHRSSFYDDIWAILISFAEIEAGEYDIFQKMGNICFKENYSDSCIKILIANIRNSFQFQANKIDKADPKSAEALLKFANIIIKNLNSSKYLRYQNLSELIVELEKIIVMFDPPKVQELYKPEQNAYNGQSPYINKGLNMSPNAYENNYLENPKINMNEAVRAGPTPQNPYFAAPPSPIQPVINADTPVSPLNYQNSPYVQRNDIEKKNFLYSPEGQAILKRIENTPPKIANLANGQASPGYMELNKNLKNEGKENNNLAYANVVQNKDYTPRIEVVNKNYIKIHARPAQFVERVDSPVYTPDQIKNMMKDLKYIPANNFKPAGAGIQADIVRSPAVNPERQYKIINNQEIKYHRLGGSPNNLNYQPAYVANRAYRTII